MNIWDRVSEEGLAVLLYEDFESRRGWMLIHPNDINPDELDRTYLSWAWGEPMFFSDYDNKEG